MLLKCSRATTLVPSKGKGKLTRSGTVMRMTMSTGSTMTSRVHRKVIRIPSKRHPGKAIPGKLHSMTRPGTGKITQGKRILNQTRATPAHCDNSNDSGLGFDHHVETPTYTPNVRTLTQNRLNKDEGIVTTIPSTISSLVTSTTTSKVSLPSTSNSILVKELKKGNEWSNSNNSINNGGPSTSRKRMIKNEDPIEIDDNCSNDAFAFTNHQKKAKPTVVPSTASSKLVSSPLTRNSPRPTMRRPGGLIAVQPSIGCVSSKDGKVQLQILAQPEQQHRARYQTEGSRGAVKDRSGNGFPVVKLIGYNKPTVLEIFIGTDIGRVAPHMFYQACKVSGKNSTQCVEKKLEGTIVIEIELKPENDMTATCDCVGILKERNVDVEHRFPDQSGPRSKKKSTRCRMVFRTQLTNDDGTLETIQVCSQQIICTQPPGVPEICKKSLTSCSAMGGLELFIIGKNFLKDTRVIFQATRSSSPNHHDDQCYDVVWEKAVMPDKEFLQQTHLVCVVPPYVNPDITSPVNVHLFVTSSNKKSESHNFLYTPIGPHSGLLMSPTSGTVVGSSLQNDMMTNNQDIRYTDETSNPSCPLMIWNPSIESPINELDAGMMPPPSTLPLSVRRPSINGQLLCDQISPPMLKSEILDESSQGSLPDTMNHDSMDRLQQSTNENSMDDNSPLKDTCAALQYAVQQQQQQQQQQRIRKHSIDLMDNNSMCSLGVPVVGGGNVITNGNNNSVDILMHDSNSMGSGGAFTHNMNMMQLDTSSPELKVVDLRVKQEQMTAAHLQQQQQLLQIAPSTATTASMCNKFLTNIDAATMNQQQITDSVAVALFTQNNRNNSNSSNSNNNDVIFTTQNLNNLNVSTNSPTIDQQQQHYSQHNLMTDTTSIGPSAMSPHILSYSSTSPINNNSNTNTNTNSNLMDAIHSPLSQDVILNSPASHISGNGSTNSMSMLSSPTTNVPQTPMNMSSDIILNPTVSPTMMCHTNDQTNLIQTQVTSVLTCHPMTGSGQNIQTSPTILGNMMQPMISPTQQQQQQQQQSQDQQIHIPRTSPVAVKNMILNAAADILSSQPSTISAESTINALISLNSETMMSVDQPTSVPPMMITQVPSTIVTGQQSNGLINSMCGVGVQQQQQSTQQQGSLDQQMFDSSSMMTQEMVPATTSSIMGSMSDMLNQELRQDQLRRAQQDFINDMNRQNMNNCQQQTSLLQAVSLVPKLVKPDDVAAAAVAEMQMQVGPQNNVVQTPNTTTAGSTNIPQDIATMSDNDLIRYINPSCFDQV